MSLWSLPVRILLTNVCLLIVPLLIYFSLVFHADAKKALPTALNTLEHFAHDQVDLIAARLNKNFTSLEVMQALLQLSQPNPVKDVDVKLAQWQQTLRCQEIYFSLLDPDLVRFSSDPGHIGAVPNERSFLKQAQQAGKSVFLSYLHDQPQITVSISVKEKGVLSLARTLETLQAADLPYNARLSLLTKEKVVFASSDPAFIGAALLALSVNKVQATAEEEPLWVQLRPLQAEPMQDVANSWQWKEGTVERVAILVPIHGTEQSLLIDCSRSAIGQEFWHDIWLILLLLTAAVIVTSLLSWLFTHRMGKPIDKLYALMDQLVQGDYSAQFSPQPFGYEFNTLGTEIEKMAKELKKHTETVATEKAAKELLAKELRIGREIQMSILPHQMPAFQGIEMQAKSLPALEVGGDFYDIYTVRHNLVVSIADGAGKGTAACLYSLCLRSILRSYAAGFLSVGKMMQLSNNLFCMDTKKNMMFATALTIMIDSETKRMSYSSFGHPPCLVRRQDGSIEKLSTHGLPMGVQELQEPQESDFLLQTGDLIILYTDGVTDAQNQRKEFFGEERLLEFIRLRGSLPTALFLQDFYREIASFSQGSLQYDDITVVVMRVR